MLLSIERLNVDGPTSFVIADGGQRCEAGEGSRTIVTTLATLGHAAAINAQVMLHTVHLYRSTS